MLKNKFFWIILSFFFFNSSCFLVIKHNDPNPSIMSVHLLPPKLKEMRLEHPLNVVAAMFPIEFDLKFSDKKAPVFFDYSHIPKEFTENLSSTLESGYINSVKITERNFGYEKLDPYFKFLAEQQIDLGILGRIKKFEVFKKQNEWTSSISGEFYILLHTGEMLKKEEINVTLDKLVFPENVTLDYQLALASSAAFNNIYETIFGVIKTNADKIEAAIIPREVKGKGVFTLRRGQKVRGKARVLVDVRVRILLNDVEGAIISSRTKLEEKVKSYIEVVKKNEQYKLVINIKDVSQTLYPFKDGRLIYDENEGYYSINYIATKEFYVSAGKSLVISSFYVPKISETITKGTYVDINPEKGLTLGFNLLCETKNNFVDMAFIK